MKIKVSVTAEDIANGQRRHGMKCPLALAIKRVYPNASCVRSEHLLMKKSPGLPWIEWPSEVKCWLLHYDVYGKTPDPIEFEMEVP